MWIVRLALRRPYTFVVAAMLVAILGVLMILWTPTDIFPDIRIPVIGVVWQYTGLPPDQMSGRITTPFQRALTTTVNDIEHITANSYNGFGIIKIFFQPNVDIRTANAQVTGISQTLLKQMPPGATPPLILNYSASTVPIIQVALSGDGLTEQNLHAELGRSIVWVEQYAARVLALADIVYILGRGRIAWAGEPSELRASPVLRQTYLGGAA